ncbi:MAG TPA: S53 family peptidase [Mycobacteriales bacterium]|nr:S53 family peptidase [Mycobacteriales bacterium]
MLHRVAKSCLPVVLSAGMIAAVGATSVPAAAAPSTDAVTVVLKAHHLAALRHLAARHGLTHAHRVRAVERLLPSEAQHREVVAALRAAGLKVTGETAWSVSAVGNSTDVTNAFGSHAEMHPHATAAQRRAASGPYPSLPASIRNDAALAYQSGSGPARYRNYAAASPLTGSDFRNAYTSADLTAHGQPPYAGEDPKATLTIATVQFASWNPSDLATFANSAGISYDPATDLTIVPVDQSTVPTPTTDDDGDIEVDLDQEGILTTAPYAHQRPYFAPNDGAGYVDALAQVLDDVLQDSRAYHGGDPHIVALSSSWGLCELDTGAPSITAMEPVLASLLAAGVTIFGSSGDDGIYDQCSASGSHVDYPASSPEVIGVGGTTLAPVNASAPNDGTNWTETGWDCVSITDCSNNGGSGGGISGDAVSPGFDRPTYQNLLQTGLFAKAKQRLVPDISANGDPATGLRIFTSDPANGAGTLIVGGTSLAAPVSAALFTNALAAHAVTFGAVDVLPALYTAQAANDGSFRDITTGTNGAAADAGGDPSVAAGPGYDTVSGLGAPLWPKIVDRVLNPLAWPTATASIQLTSPHSSSSPYRVEASWTGTPASGGLDVNNAEVRITQVGHSGTVYSNLNAPANGSHSFTANRGSTYQVSVTAYDLAGTTSVTKTSTLAVPIDDRNFAFYGSWQRKRGGSDFGGSLAQTSHRGAAASVNARGTTYSVLVHTGPSFGTLVVSQHGHEVKSISLHSGHSSTKKVTFFHSGSASNRRFDFFCRGGTVNVDALYVTR